MPKGETAGDYRTLRRGAAGDTAPRARRRRAAVPRYQVAGVSAATDESFARTAAFIIGNSRITIMFWRAIGDVRPALAAFDSLELAGLPGTGIAIMAGSGEIAP
jgi:hypothetical protein